jgi:hypothetical protein
MSGKKTLLFWIVLLGWMVFWAWGCRSVFPTSSLPTSINWSTVGKKGFTSLANPSGSFLSLCVDNTTPYLAVEDGGVSISVMTFNGNSWSFVGSPDFTTCFQTYIVPSMFCYNGTPNLEFFAPAGEFVSANYSGGSGWVGLAGPTLYDVGEGAVPPYTFYQGTPYAFDTDSAHSYAGVVISYTGAAWVTLGNPDFAPYPYFPAICVSNSVPYVAFTDGTGLITVMKLSGSTWVTLGNPGTVAMPNNNALYLSASNGSLFIAFSDASYGGSATVMKWNGSSWGTLGNPGFTSAGIGFGDSSFYAYNGTPNLAFLNSNSQLVVMQFNGNGWFDLGGGALTPTSAYFPSLFVSDGTPYVAFFDGSANGQATVMKYM